MRVIGGVARGRLIAAPAGRGVRPTSDRVREALFSSLSRALPGARVLDLFAGSGALGIEALSRGATSAVFVERDRRAAAAVEDNLRRTGLGPATVVRGDARRFCAEYRGAPFDIVFCDPPYRTAAPVLWSILDDLRASGGVSQDCRVVIERDRHRPPLAGVPEWLALEGVRSYGDTVLCYLRAVGSAASREKAQNEKGTSE
jgi:16S rRNA (guanine966-N2)-methyltransferase